MPEGRETVGPQHAVEGEPGEGDVGIPSVRSFGLVSLMHRNQGFKSANHQSQPPIQGNLLGHPRPNDSATENLKSVASLQLDGFLKKKGDYMGL